MAARLDLSVPLRRLEGLGQRVRGEVFQLAAQAADSLLSELRSRYPIGPTGNLQRRVSVVTSARGSAVVAKAPHAHLYEYGTKVRNNYTRAGANRGRMPRADVFVPAAVQIRREYLDSLNALINEDIDL